MPDRGGYTAAFYAAAKGKKVILVEREPRLGGVCLNRGCIPSKALLHATELIREARSPRIAASLSTSRALIWKSCGRGRTPSSTSLAGGIRATGQITRRRGDVRAGLF